MAIRTMSGNDQDMKSTLASIGIAVGILTFSNAASADEYHARCVARGSTSTDFAKCGNELVEREEAALTQTWRRVYGGLTSHAAKTRLLAEQRKWIAYKDSACLLFTTAEEFGSMGWSIELPSCRARVIRERVNQLNDYRTHSGG